MKRILPIVVALAVGAGAGAWLAHRHALSGMQMDGAAAQANPPEGEPGHKHVLVKKTDAQGKTYYTCSMHPQVRTDQPGQCPICGMQLIKKMESASAPAPADASGERTPMYWYDPMRPDQHFDKPGKSPFMDMQLVPKYADEDSKGGSDLISIDSRTLQNLGIRTAPVERRQVSGELRAVGTVAADENRIQVVQTRAQGWIEHLHVRAVNDTVKKGQLLAEVYAPDLFAAQQEFVLATKAKDPVLAAGARQRLLLLGLSESQVGRLAQTSVPQRRVSYYAPVDGIVTELGAREGAQVMPGMALYTLADLSKVWVVGEVPEAQAASLAPGGAAEARFAALPGRTFSGRVDYVVPEVNPQTRTVRVRTVLDNEGSLLKPGMFADMLLSRGQTRDALMVPSEALIRTGTRNTVIVAEAEGRFRPVEVQLGMQRDGQTEILSGLQAGQQVVASGQFLIDSEANLRGAYSKLDTSTGGTDGAKRGDAMAPESGMSNMDKGQER